MAEALPSVDHYGIKPLIAVDKLKLIQKTEHLMQVRNKYEINNQDEQLMYYALEEGSDKWWQKSSSKHRPFSINFVDTHGLEVFRIRRHKQSWSGDKLEVIMANGLLVSEVKQKLTWLKPVLLIKDGAGNLVLEVKGSIPSPGQCDFEVRTPDETPIGVISRKWRGWKKELSGNCKNDEYEIEFPLDLDVRFKIALIGACIMLDFLLFEPGK